MVEARCQLHRGDHRTVKKLSINLFYVKFTESNRYGSLLSVNPRGVMGRLGFRVGVSASCGFLSRKIASMISFTKFREFSRKITSCKSCGSNAHTQY